MVLKLSYLRVKAVTMPASASGSQDLTRGCVSTSHNSLLIGIHQALTGWLTEQRNHVLAVEGTEQAAFNAHLKIFQALADRDQERAEHEMAQHMDAVISAYWDQAKSRAPE